MLFFYIINLKFYMNSLPNIYLLELLELLELVDLK